MKEEERKKLEEVLDSVRPYIMDFSNLKDAVTVISKESSDLDDFLKKFESLTSTEEDPSTKTDMKILLNKLKASN